MAAKFDLKTPEVTRDPAPIFVHMLQEQPVHYSPSLKGWGIADYDNVKLALSDPRFSVEKISPFAQHMAGGVDARKIPELTRILDGWIVFKDPPPITACTRYCSTRSSQGKWESCAPPASKLPKRSRPI